MLKIHPIPAFTDNYIWAIINDETQEVIIVDAGDDKPVLDFVKNQNLTISQIWVTHHHSDHIGGVTALANAFPNAQIFAHVNIHPLINATHLIPVAEGRELTAWGSPVQVWQVAGHTENHLPYSTFFSLNPLLRAVSTYCLFNSSIKLNLVKYASPANPPIVLAVMGNAKCQK